MNYPFLTQKERDVETGLDYFLARYYSATQGRFTSPDEFSGGPDELYYFVDTASANPTFYADLRNPQSLNKYQYDYNNPLRYVDPHGHTPDQKCKCPTDQQIIDGVTSVLDTVADATGITTLADWLRTNVPAAVQKIAGSQPCMDPGTCGQQIILQQQTTPKELVVDAKTNPESAANVKKAEQEGRPTSGVVDRDNKDKQRRENLKGVPTKPGMDRDEVPPAVIRPDPSKLGPRVDYVTPRDNRSAGSSIGRQLKGIANGERVVIKVINWWKDEP